jgi:uvrD/REP helicase
LESINYSKSQREAVEFGAGPMMVLAGPGSGKTFVITHRVCHLIEKQNIRPENILVVTFSKAAAVEMRERFIKLMPDKQDERVTWGTFHSVYFHLLRTAYGYRGDQVITDAERYDVIRELMKKNQMESEDVVGLGTEILSEIAIVKQERMDILHYYAHSCPADLFRQIFVDYEKSISERKKIDFEDMLVMTYELLSQREDIRRACENRYQYILVDEFQDINRMQYEIIQLIAGERANLTIVGDDDQSIYRFRGAKPEIMLGFAKDYPKVKKVLLDINFRSTTQIIEAAGKLIAHNKERFEKQITAARGNGRPVDVIRFKNVYQEVKSIIDDISDYVKAGHSLDDIAILYRTNLQPRLMTEMLMQYNIPFVMKDNIPNLYDHWIARDIKSYLRLSIGMAKRGDLLRICNRPNRYIKREALQFSDGQIRDLFKYYEDKPYMIERIAQLKTNLRAIQNMRPGMAVRFIRKGIGYDEFLEEYAQYHGIEEDELLDILGELEQSADRSETILDWFSHMEEYKEKLAQTKKQEEKIGVRLMTFHSSKGLEYKIVYMIDCNQGITPHRKAKAIEDMEEERRMFYVAMTRAKDRLYVYSADSSFHKKAELSDFVKEIL